MLGHLSKCIWMWLDLYGYNEQMHEIQHIIRLYQALILCMYSSIELFLLTIHIASSLERWNYFSSMLANIYIFDITHSTYVSLTPYRYASIFVLIFISPKMCWLWSCKYGGMLFAWCTFLSSLAFVQSSASKAVQVFVWLHFRIIYF